jgi:hypothetical protein
MTALLFFAYVVLMAIIVMALAARYLPRRTTLLLLAGLSLWLIYVGALSYFGVVANPHVRPPGPVLIFAPFMVFVFLLSVSSAGARAAAAFPLWVLLATQAFRIGVELLLHRMWMDGLVPRMMTYSGANFDIYVGLSAPLIAWASTRGRSGQQIALAWNFLALLVLTNVVVRAVLTTPGPLNFLHDDFANLAILKFPFTYIAGLFVPLAVTLHVLSIRSLRSRMGSVRPSAAAA